MEYAMFEEILSEIIREIFTAIISSKDMNGRLEYIQDKFNKLFENATSLRFFSHEIKPTNSCMIVNKCYKPTSTRDI